MSLEKYKKILKNYGIEVTKENSKLFASAITHGSYAYEKDLDNYQRLEFLGDAVVDLVVSNLIYNEFTESTEGDLTNIRAKLVKTETLASISIRLELNTCVFLSVSEIRDNGALKEKLCADIYESTVGAIFIAFGYRKAEDFIKNTLIRYEYDKKTALNNAVSYKTILQEALGINSVKYVLEKDEILESNKHNFVIKVQINNVVYGVGEGPSKKVAEKNAAKEALQKLNLL
ncbi:ribonuclease III [Spiroplasma endosymbiont of Aspidapion aeneum]|uniref:ribonuclease III n=1 Tax=Spiroplasma endosymbiont of Aspidapion aeneum TaxID=3066276 RepID=UPI00313C8B60